MSIFKIKKVFIFGILLSIVFGFYLYFFYSPYKFRGNGAIKILWIDTYNQDNSWSSGQINGLKDYLKDNQIQNEIKSVSLNAYNNPKEDDIEKKINEIRQLINDWEPDIIYATDDEAQKYVSKYYINTKIPWVFSGVNLDLETYGFDKARNVAGILEIKPADKLLNLTKQLLPDAKNITVLGVNNIAGLAIQRDLRAAFAKDNSFNIVRWEENMNNYSDLKEAIKQAQEDSDLIILAWMGPFLGENNVTISGTETILYLIKNSKIPELTFWNDLTTDGAFASVEVSSYKTGYYSGEIIKKILINGEKPSNLVTNQVIVDKQSINTARGKILGIYEKDIPSLVLINSIIVEKFLWEQ